MQRKGLCLNKESVAGSKHNVNGKREKTKHFKLTQYFLEAPFWCPFVVITMVRGTQLSYTQYTRNTCCQQF